MSSIIKASSVKLENVSVFDYMEHEEQQPENYESDAEIIKVEDAKPEDEDDFLYEKELEEEVRIRVEHILNNAKLEAEKLKNNANVSGYEEGYSKGMQDAEEYKNNVTREYNEKLTSEKEKLKVQNAEYICQLKNEALEMIIKISKKVMSDALETNEKLILNLIIMGLTKISDVDQIIIKLSNSDFKTVSENKSQIQKYFDDSVRITITIDEKMSPGDCVFETPYGIIDCGVQTKMDSIVEQIKKVAIY